MADQQVGNVHGLPIADVGAATSPTNLSGTNVARTGFSDTDMLSVTALRSRLGTIDGTFYTAAKLDSMTYNDMVYAVRVNDHSGSIKQ